MAMIEVFIKQQSEIARLADAAAMLADHGSEVVVSHVLGRTAGADGERVILEQAVARLRADGLTARSRLVRTDQCSVAQCIVEHVQKEQPELLVLGARRLGRFGVLVQRSVSQQVLARCHAPVLIVPDDALVDRRLRHVLVAVGGEEDAGRLIRAVLALPPMTRISAVHVKQRVAIHAFGPGSPYLEVGQGSAPALGRIRSSLVRAHRQAATRLLENRGGIAGSILHDADASGVDLIVIGSHRPGRLATVAEGSTARQILRLCRRPVLFVA
jgi:nucleotide-binding universal stress UspA family protein